MVSGCIKTIKNDELAGRIGIIVEHISELVATYRPTVAAVERVFVNVNPAATLMLGQARGAAIAALVLRGLPVYEYTALQVKQAGGGAGQSGEGASAAHGGANAETVGHAASRCGRRLGDCAHPRAAESRLGGKAGQHASKRRAVSIGSLKTNPSNQKTVWLITPSGFVFSG